MLWGRSTGPQYDYDSVKRWKTQKILLQPYQLRTALKMKTVALAHLVDQHQS